MKIKTLSSALVAGSMLFASPAFAQQSAQKNDGLYLAAEIGSLVIQDYCDPLFTSCSDSEIAWGADIGYRFNEYLAVEMGGRFAEGYDITVSVPVTGGDPVAVAGKAEISSLLLGGRVSYPFNDNFFVFGKTGLNVTEVKLTASSTNAVASASVAQTTEETDLYYGVGAGYLFGDTFEFRLDYTRYQYNEDKGDMLAGSFALRF